MWEIFKFRVLQCYGPAKVASMLTGVLKCQEGQYIGLIQGKSQIWPTPWSYVPFEAEPNVQNDVAISLHMSSIYY